MRQSNEDFNILKDAMEMYGKMSAYTHDARIKKSIDDTVKDLLETYQTQMTEYHKRSWYEYHKHYIIDCLYERGLK